MNSRNLFVFTNENQLPHFDSDVAIVAYEAAAHIGERLADLQVGVGDQHQIVIGHFYLLVRLVEVLFLVEPFELIDAGQVMRLMRRQRAVKENALETSYIITINGVNMKINFMNILLVENLLRITRFLGFPFLPKSTFFLFLVIYHLALLR